MKFQLESPRFGFVIGAVMLAGAVSPVANASSEAARYTHPDCKGENVACGVIVMGNAGAFVVDWVSVNARDSQPDQNNTHPSCANAGHKFDRNLEVSEYDTFILPASCAYKLKIKILSANNKDQNLFLTPGCQIVTTVKGTTSSNSWKGNKVTALNDQVPVNKDKAPVNASGYKCGKQGSAGF